MSLCAWGAKVSKCDGDVGNVSITYTMRVMLAHYARIKEVV